MRPLRLAYARISQETNALSPLRTELEDFERVHYLEGDALGDRTLRPRKYRGRAPGAF